MKIIDAEWEPIFEEVEIEVKKPIKKSVKKKKFSIKLSDMFLYAIFGIDLSWVVYRTFMRVYLYGFGALF